MIPVLQISIPTYNRQDKLTAVIDSLSSLSELINAGRITILIFDNSDKDQSNLFGSKINGLINYNYNGGNIGFHKNIKKCLIQGEAIFKWIMADDDEIEVSEIPKIVEYLHLNADKIDGMILPYNVRNIITNDKLQNSSLSLNIGSLIRFGDAVLPTRIPFDFISEFIIKSEILRRIDVENINSKNDYIHSFIYCSCLAYNDVVTLYDCPVITYKPPETLNWPLLQLLKSKLEISTLLNINFKIYINQSKLLSEALKWAIFGRIGATKIRGLDGDLGGLVRLALNDRSIVNLLLALLLVLPKYIAREVVIFALAVSRRNSSKSGLLQRMQEARFAVRIKD
jgi:hypothetical protein